MADKPILIKNIKGEPKYGPNKEIIRAPNRGYFDMAVSGESKFPLKVRIGEVIGVGDVQPPLKSIPKWAFNRLAGLTKIDGALVDPSPILVRAFSEGIVQIEGSPEAVKRLKSVIKAQKDAAAKAAAEAEGGNTDDTPPNPPAGGNAGDS